MKKAIKIGIGSVVAYALIFIPLTVPIVILIYGIRNPDELKELKLKDITKKNIVKKFKEILN